MALLQCEMCCGELDISPDKSVGVCKYCGSTFTIPKEIEKKGNLFNRANYLRQSCNFDKAISVYESILSENCEDADALWGLVLCRYGIEFVEDPKTKERIPTCHRTSRTSILLDPDFKSALQFADEEKKTVYYEQASKIDHIQKAILSLSEVQEKYDVFICYKETDENGERTVDSVLAQELYNELQKLKIKTFFARKTLEGKVGSSYEPIIYSALNSAKVMIVLGTKPEHFEATWVKNEWSRYLDFMKDSDDKHLIPAYRDMSAYQLPEEFMAIQALDMSRIGFMLDLCDGVKKLLHKDEKVIDEVGASPISKESLYSRAMVFLGNREFYKAIDYFDKVLDIDPKYAKAYWGSLLANYQCVNNNELVNCETEDWTGDARFHNAMQFAGEEEKSIYEDALSRRGTTVKKLAHAALENRDFEKCCVWCDKVLVQDNFDGSIWWVKLLAMHGAGNSNELFDNCVRDCALLTNTKEYINAIKYSIPEETIMYEKLAVRIDAAVAEKKRSIAYEDCKNYMSSVIGTMARRKKEGAIERWKNCEKEAEAFAQLRAHNGKFYQNNFFMLLLRVLLWAVPIYAALAYFFITDGDTENFYMTFAIMFSITIALVLFISFCKYLSGAKRTKLLMYMCSTAAIKRAKDMQPLEKIAQVESYLRALYDSFLRSPDMSVEEIESRREAFQAAYEKK